jgi:hypothetical protein
MALEQCIAENKHPFPSTLGNHLFCEHHVDDETLTTYIKTKHPTKKERKNKKRTQIQVNFFFKNVLKLALL